MRRRFKENEDLRIQQIADRCGRAVDQAINEALDDLLDLGLTKSEVDGQLQFALETWAPDWFYTER